MGWIFAAVEPRSPRWAAYARERGLEDFGAPAALLVTAPDSSSQTDRLDMFLVSSRPVFLGRTAVQSLLDAPDSTAGGFPGDVWQSVPDTVGDDPAAANNWVRARLGQGQEPLVGDATLVGDLFPNRSAPMFYHLANEDCVVLQLVAPPGAGTLDAFADVFGQVKVGLFEPVLAANPGAGISRSTHSVLGGGPPNGVTAHLHVGLTGRYAFTAADNADWERASQRLRAGRADGVSAEVRPLDGRGNNRFRHSFGLHVTVLTGLADIPGPPCLSVSISRPFLTGFGIDRGVACLADLARSWATKVGVLSGYTGLKRDGGGTAPSPGGRSPWEAEHNQALPRNAAVREYRGLHQITYLGPDQADQLDQTAVQALTEVATVGDLPTAAGTGLVITAGTDPFEPLSAQTAELLQAALKSLVPDGQQKL